MGPQAEVSKAGRQHHRERREPGALAEKKRFQNLSHNWLADHKDSQRANSFCPAWVDGRRRKMGGTAAM